MKDSRTAILDYVMSNLTAAQSQYRAIRRSMEGSKPKEIKVVY